MARIWSTAFESYSIGTAIGQGGAGTVYEATDTTGGTWAVKALDVAKATSDRKRRFKNELEFCRSERHPNVIRVFDYGVTPEGAPFFVMRRYSRTLRDHITNVVSPTASLRIFAALLDGVEAAHLYSATHRDLKPENILLDDNANPIVADFGIAHFEEEDLITAVETRDGVRLANFQYAAPEQRSRKEIVDHRADIYALGLILNELFTKRVPQGTGYERIGPTFPDYEYLDEVVDQMIQQSPSKRPESIDRIKQLLTSRLGIQVARQTLSARTLHVVNRTEVQDPVAADPMRIVSTDYDPRGYLVFSFNHSVPPQWANALRDCGGPYTHGEEPHMMEFAGATGRIPVSQGREVHLKGFVEQWIQRANHSYANELKEEARQRERDERKRIEQDRQAAEYRLQVLKQLNP